MAKEKKGVRLEHISKIYQDPKTKKDFYAVKDTNLEIEPGSFVTLLGPSGCGKTTTLRMIAGFESPDEGEIYLGDEPINELTPNKRDTAMVFQSYALLPHYNIFDNVAYGLKIRKVPKELGSGASRRVRTDFALRCRRWARRCSCAAWIMFRYMVRSEKSGDADSMTCILRNTAARRIGKRRRWPVSVRPDSISYP